MKLKAVSGIMLTLLLISMLTLAFNIQPVKASGTISTACMHAACIHAQVGDSFTIDVNITDVIGLCGYEFKLLWNTTILDCVDSTINRIWYPDDWVIRDEILENYNSTHGRYFVAYLPLPLSEFNGNTTLVSLTFESMETGNCTLHLYDIKLGDCSANPIEYTSLDGSVTIVPFMYSSDLDGDGFVGISDLSVAALAWGSFPGHPKWNPIADLNKDGWVNIADIAKIAADFGKTV